MYLEVRRLEPSVKANFLAKLRKYECDLRVRQILINCVGFV
jgi:hypothetical protein